MLLLLPSGPVLAVADTATPTADGLLVHAWRQATLEGLFPDQHPRPNPAGPYPFTVIVTRRELARALQRQLSTLHHRDLRAMTAGDVTYGLVAGDVLTNLAALDWSLPLAQSEPAADMDCETPSAVESDYGCEVEADAA